ncbi:MAG TPA: 50S ribosomal protein L16 [Candidatus Kapabacteria bacterium]|jgi:large subunit ribosomal protein L16|nr:50S ribosomal protein L16 [Candidatus Kapabacteria bacterium]HOM04700.1 50S ribosomal protein L16 [Candidatus Kapabacteria bacterium]HOQ48476.1 50S ribosomal protein L16 [Candidatus Kapabacteria bacterium]
MLSPKRIRYRKAQRGVMRGNSNRGHLVAFGSYGLKALEEHWITNRQIEAARIAINRYLKRDGKVWIRIFPDKPYTKKPAETRQGSGKGSPEGWVAAVRPGRILFEVDGVSREAAQEALRLASHKLPIKTKFVTRIDLAYNETT